MYLRMFLKFIFYRIMSMKQVLQTLLLEIHFIKYQFVNSSCIKHARDFHTQTQHVYQKLDRSASRFL